MAAEGILGVSEAPKHQMLRVALSRTSFNGRLPGPDPQMNTSLSNAARFPSFGTRKLAAGRCKATTTSQDFRGARLNFSDSDSSFNSDQGEGVDSQGQNETRVCSDCSNRATSGYFAQTGGLASVLRRGAKDCDI